MLGHYPFLEYVATVEDFDQQLMNYVLHDYVKQKYQDTLGCDSVSLKNTSNLYARYTTSIVCAGVVQDSKSPCSVSNPDAPPLCAESCAQNARSEENIALNSSLCGTPKKGYLSEIRADFTVCSLPVNSLSGGCITGDMNESENCGFMNNLPGLCGYCAKSSPNATDSCCANSKVDTRCKDFDLPEPTATIPPLFPTTSAASTAATSNKHGLSGGAIAGAVIGSVAGAILLIVLPCLYFYLRRRRNQAHSASIFNQPNPSVPRERKPSGLDMSDTSAPMSTPRQSRLIAIAGQEGTGGGQRGTMMSNPYEVLMTPRSCGREMRMSAIQTEPLDMTDWRGNDAHSNHPRHDGRRDSYGIGSTKSAAGGGMVGDALGRQGISAYLDDDVDEGTKTPEGSQMALVRRQSQRHTDYADALEGGNNRDSGCESDFKEKPTAVNSDNQMADVYTTPKRARGTPPTVNQRRQGSLGSTSMLNPGAIATPDQQPYPHRLSPSPSSNLGTTSVSNVNSSRNPETSPGNTSTQSEQLSSFKDYYSQGFIRPADEVAVLWAYTPRADDEFTLERGQMLKVKGIWDDGWATGVMLKERVDEWEAIRDSESGTEGAEKQKRMTEEGEEDVKAFPLVCVCLPQHWRKAVEAEISL
ncbi:hypothetical protein KEM54_004050 [Ascosphaera aggregata]|nr:hypothetical protein KEM54_004050 [Ascosphaera aggregata]